MIEKCCFCGFSQKEGDKLKCLSISSEVDYTQPQFRPLDALRSEMLESEGVNPEKYQRQLYKALQLMIDPTTTCFKESLALLELLAEVEERRKGKQLLPK